MEKPDVDLIEGLSPAISIEQKSTSHNPRSTVGTVTEIYDYLRLLFARVGEPRCPNHGVTLAAQTVSQMVDHVLQLPEGAKLMLLAPLVDDRKGEHAHVLDTLRAQGYVRARIDGKVVSLDEAPELKKNFKHTIEAVVDRLAVKPDQGQRLAESFETAIHLGEGLVRVVVLNEDNSAKDEIVFSARYACPHCGYSISELEPRLFSFNNPAGACPTCDGLGVRQFFDPARILTDASLPLPAGAIRGWDRRNAFYYQMLESLARHYDFSLDTPFEDLPKKIRDVILHGSGTELVTFSYLGENGARTRRKHPFEGVIPNLERRYRETESSNMQEELAKYLSSQPCTDCQGSRLKIEARNVFVANRALHEITQLPVGVALGFFEGLTLPGHRGEIAAKILKEVRARLGFLVNVGLDYLSLARAAETLSGGESQRIRLASQIGAGLVGVMYVLDEPSIGLHQRDNARLLETLRDLRDLGNTVIVVEHDEEAIRAADFVLDIGPGAGVHGGQVVAQGTPAEVTAHPQSITGAYLRGDRRIEVPAARTPNNPDKQLVIRSASGNNLKKIDASIPVGLLTCITGVSGSGKSTLINDTLYASVAKHLYGSNLEPAPCEKIDGLEHFDKVVDIDQAPIGRTPPV